LWPDGRPRARAGNGSEEPRFLESTEFESSLPFLATFLFTVMTSVIWNGHSYVGDVDAENKFHGKGEIVWKNGNKYTGKFAHGKMDGVGKLEFNVDSIVFPAKKGNVYHGEWKASRWQGRGKLMSAQGVVLKAGGWNDCILVQSEKELEDSALQGRLETDGFALRPVQADVDVDLWKGLQQLLGDRFTLARAWSVNHPVHRDFYEAGLERVVTELKRFEQSSGTQLACSHAPGFPIATADIANSILTPLRPSANEALLMHGTSPNVILNILSSGLSERFSGLSAGTRFGKGIYFAEDVRKCDRYATVDNSYSATSDCHKYLYASADEHSGEVRYLFVCRVALGAPLRTNESGQQAVDQDGGRPVFPVVYGELATVPDVSPPMHYHSLIGSGTLREFIVFHNEYVSVEYLIAYKRENSAQ